MIVQVGQNTVAVQVQSSGVGAALALLQAERAGVEANLAAALAAKVAAEAAEVAAEAAEVAAEAARDEAETARDVAVAASAEKADRTLSNLSSVSTARTNMGLGGAALLNVGTTAGTVAAGDDLRMTAQPQAQAFWRKVRAANEDIVAFFCGDSTGNETTEHYYLTAQWIASEAPTHTVTYYLWNDGSSTYDSPVTLQTGTGARTIAVYNCSVAGKNTEYIEAARGETIFALTPKADLVVMSYGHNTGTDTTEEIILPEFRISAALMLQRFPEAGVFVTLQAPRKNFSSGDPGGPEQSNRMVSAWRRVAQEMGLGVIDAYTAFANHPNFDVAPGVTGSLYADVVHPSATGSILWSAQDQIALAEAPQLLATGGQSISPFNVIRPNLCPNPTFSDWSGSTPTGWTFTSVTPSKNPGLGDGSLYSLEALVGGGVNPKMEVDLSSALPRVSGKTASLLVKIRKTATLDTSLGARIGITATNGTTSAPVTAYPRIDSAGGYYYALCSLDIPTGMTSLTGLVYLGASDGSDSGELVNVASVWFGEGVLPSALDPSAEVGKELLELFSAENVGKQTGTGGTLTVSGGDLILTGATAPNTDVYVNLLGLVPGREYEARWTFISDSNGYASGTLALRNGLNGGSSSISSVGYTNNYLSFVAPSGPVSLRFNANSLATGFRVDDVSIGLYTARSGIDPALAVPLTSGRSDDGAVLDATGAAGDFKVVFTPGTAIYLQTEDAQGNTKTDAVSFEVVIPDDYVAGRNLTLNLSAIAVAGSGTLGTKTLDVQVYPVTAAGVASGDLCTTAAQNITTTSADYEFAITGTTLEPRDKLLVRVVMVIQETGGSNPSSGQLSAVTVS